jgi:hypothetical protein
MILKEQEGSGGLTSVSVNGALDFKNAAKTNSVYVEFDVPTNSLIIGGKDGWYKIVGPNARPSQQYLLSKQGGEFLPKIDNIQVIDKK